MPQISKQRIGCDGNRRLLVGAEAGGKVSVEIIISRAGVWHHVATLVLQPADAQILINDLTAAKAYVPPAVPLTTGRRARRLAGLK